MTNTTESEVFESEMLSVVRQLSASTLELSRTVSFGGAGVLTAILLLLLQTGVPSNSLKVALTACAVGIPSFIVHAKLLGHYLFFGQATYQRLLTFSSSSFLFLFLFVGVASLLVSLTSIFWHLSKVSSIVFVVACTISTAAIFYHQHQVKALANVARPGV